ncbi:MAG: hypothetical protein V4659_07715 [Pseudomonadota bacterium]
MKKAVRILTAPAALIDSAEREERLPPGSGLLFASFGAFVCYAAIVATVA